MGVIAQRRMEEVELHGGDSLRSGFFTQREGEEEITAWPCVLVGRFATLSFFHAKARRRKGMVVWGRE
jgi:hypothetical protein